MPRRCPWMLILLAASFMGCAGTPANLPELDETPARLSARKLSYGQLCERQGHTEQAVQAYLAALSLDPEQQMAYHRLAVLSAQQGQFAAADKYFHQARRLKPSTPELLNDMGYAWYLQGRLNEAEAAFKSALAQQPSFATAQKNLDMVIANQGNGHTEGLAGDSQSEQATVAVSHDAPLGSESKAAVDAPAPSVEAGLASRPKAAPKPSGARPRAAAEPTVKVVIRNKAERARTVSRLPVVESPLTKKPPATPEKPANPLAAPKQPARDPSRTVAIVTVKRVTSGAAPAVKKEAPVANASALRGSGGSDNSAEKARSNAKAPPARKKGQSIVVRDGKPGTIALQATKSGPKPLAKPLTVTPRVTASKPAIHFVERPSGGLPALDDSALDDERPRSLALQSRALMPALDDLALGDDRPSSLALQSRAQNDRDAELDELDEVKTAAEDETTSSRPTELAAVAPDELSPDAAAEEAEEHQPAMRNPLLHWTGWLGKPREPKGLGGFAEISDADELLTDESF